jgi:hypothetical protein
MAIGVQRGMPLLDCEGANRVFDRMIPSTFFPFSHSRLVNVVEAMTSPKAKRVMLEQTLHGLLCISGDTEDALRQARSMLAKVKDEDSDSEQSYNKGESCCKHAAHRQPQTIANCTLDGVHNGVHAQPIQQCVNIDAVENDNLKTTRPQQAARTPIYEDNINEEDMSLASEDEMEDTTCTQTCPLLCDDEGSEEEELVENRAEGTQVKVEGEDLPGPLRDIKKKLPLQERPAGMLYEVRIVSTIKNEVPLLTKINPAIQVDVARIQNDLEQRPLFWSMQVECAEHQVSLPPNFTFSVSVSV